MLKPVCATSVYGALVPPIVYVGEGPTTSSLMGSAASSLSQSAMYRVEPGSIGAALSVPVLASPEALSYGSVMPPVSGQLMGDPLVHVALVPQSEYTYHYHSACSRNSQVCVTTCGCS